MCGIVGIYDRRGGRPERQALLPMLDGLRHRGPDAAGLHAEPGIALGHARLSIIDPVGGAQPLRDEAARMTLSYNGEIFNYIELRRQLRGLGFGFSTDSDTEVVLRAYQAWGLDFVHRLNGQFAIALWDGNRQELLLIRDRVGIAPLYYAEQGSRLLFASEIKALLPQLDAPRPNLRALDQVFTFWTPLPGETLFEGVHELEPGQMLRVSRERMDRRRYWDWEFPPEQDQLRGDASALAEELHELLDDAVRLRLRADVPVGAYLSGGLDSSALTALIAGHSEVPLRTFSVSFDEADYDESVYQRDMIRHLGADHHIARCTAEAIGEHLPRSLWHAEVPVLRTAPVPLGLLSRAVHQQGYRVVLTGEGADEVLGGYDLFKEAKVRSFWARQPGSRWRGRLLQRLYPYQRMAGGQAALERAFGQGLDDPARACFSHLPRWAATARCKTFFSLQMADAMAAQAVDSVADLESRLPAQMAGWNGLARAQYLEAKLLLPGYLLSSQGDRMLMSNSVEGRFPFLDHRLIEFASRLPPRLKLRVLNEKYLLKQAMRRDLPASVVQRHKQPYRAPDASALQAALASEAGEAVLAEDRLRDYGYFDPKRVQLLCRKVRRGRGVSPRDQMAFTGVLSTQLWHHMFIDSYRNSNRSPQHKDDNLKLHFAAGV